MQWPSQLSGLPALLLWLPWYFQRIGTFQGLIATFAQLKLCTTCGPIHQMNKKKAWPLEWVVWIKDHFGSVCHICFYQFFSSRSLRSVLPMTTTSQCSLLCVCHYFGGLLMTMKFYCTFRGPLLFKGSFCWKDKFKISFHRFYCTSWENYTFSTKCKLDSFKKNHWHQVKMIC